MNEKTLRVLEFNTIKDMLLKNSKSIYGQDLINHLSPLINIEFIREGLRETTEATISILRRGNPPNVSMFDIRPSLKRAELGSMLSAGELLRIADIYKISRQFKKYATEVSIDSKFRIIDELIESLITNKSIEDNINNAIVNDEEISDNASATLKNIRRSINDTNNLIKDKLNQLINSTKYQKYLQDNLVTIRDGRYVVPVKQEYKNEIKGLVHDSSSTGATLFIEPMAVVDANNKLKELKINENIEIERILLELTELVSQNIDELNSNLSMLAKLDFIFSKGKLSLELKASEPTINIDGVIKLKKARHPLIDSNKVVPIDVELGEKFNNLVITGPNTGGKTVTLKTVGLLVLMTQCGLHIPVNEGSTISIFSKIFADIGDEQSIQQNLSTFSSHMKNIVEIVEQADSKSLCLFDELGAGTDPTEGAALAMSILKYLYSIRATTIATTHYSELKVFAISNSGFKNASCEFDVETLRPTYRVLMGIPGKSNAFEISKRIGLNENIINCAKEYITKENVKFEDVISTLEKDKEVVEIEKQKAVDYAKEIELLKIQLEKQNKEIEESKEKILLSARQKALEILEEAKEESDEIVKEMRQITKLQEEQEREKLINQAKYKFKNKITNVENQVVKSAIGKTDKNIPPKALKPGEEVYVVSIGQNGKAITSPDNNGNLQVQVGIMKIASNIKDLRLSNEEKVTFKNIHSDKSSIKSLDISTELSLRGEMLDDALIITDKYLDDAYLSKLTRITIIHGKGSGVLRSGIHQFLKHHPHVKSFRPGIYGEGGDGVTIVELK